MIEINLLPEEFKLKASNQFKLKERDLKKILSPLIPVAVAILVIVHIFFLGIAVITGSRLNMLNKKWAGLKSQRDELDELKKEYAFSSAALAALEQTIGRRINWAEKLNSLSLDLPAGIWLNEIVISERDFSLKGSVVSLVKEELNLINKFLDNLKRDKRFFNDFDRIDLSSVNRRAIQSYEVIDFILAGNLKSK